MLNCVVCKFVVIIVECFSDGGNPATEVALLHEKKSGAMVAEQQNFAPKLCQKSESQKGYYIFFAG